MTKRQPTPLADLLRAPAQAERDAIVRWLREQAEESAAGGYSDEAFAFERAVNVIERGEHLK